MNDHYLKKLDRVTAILTQLQSKPLVRAQDLAEKFEVSVRTIYRDIKTLENAGIPIVGEAGSGYSLMDGFKLPPIMFTKEEVLSFITAEKLMQKFSPESLGTHHQSAMEKVRSVLRFSDKSMIESIEEKVNIFNSIPKTNSIKNVIPTVLESISEKKQLSIKYQAIDGKISSRIIEVVGIFMEFNYWYILAYCNLRKDFRQFRVDRILQIFKTENSFSQEYGNVEEHRKKSGAEVTRVKLFADKKLMLHIINSKKYYGLTEEKEKEDGFELTFETEWFEEGFPRWLIGFADYVEILEPKSLKKKIEKLANEIAKKQK